MADTETVSFELGGGEAVVAAMSMRKAADLWQGHFVKKRFIELYDVRQPDDTLYVNPLQIKILQQGQPMRRKWPRSKPCLADYGKHQWKYAKDRLSRECQKCGVQQESKP